MTVLEKTKGCERYVTLYVLKRKFLNYNKRTGNSLSDEMQQNPQQIISKD